MKLKTKFEDEDFKLGEVVEANVYYAGSRGIKLTTEPTKGGGIHTFYYSTIKAFTNDWEDAPEEPQGIKSVGNIGSSVHIEFGTEEEAEKAVRKLEAWERLKDLGFKCSYHSSGYHRGTFTADFVFDEDKLPIMDVFVAKDLDTVFGGEE